MFATSFGKATNQGHTEYVGFVEEDGHRNIVRAVRYCATQRIYASINCISPTSRQTCVRIEVLGKALWCDHHHLPDTTQDTVTIMRKLVDGSYNLHIQGYSYAKRTNVPFQRRPLLHHEYILRYFGNVITFCLFSCLNVYVSGFINSTPPSLRKPE